MSQKSNGLIEQIKEENKEKSLSMEDVEEAPIAKFGNVHKQLQKLSRNIYGGVVSHVDIPSHIESVSCKICEDIVEEILVQNGLCYGFVNRDY